MRLILLSRKSDNKNRLIFRTIVQAVGSLHPSDYRSLLPIGFDLYFEFLATLITESALVKSRDMLSGWMCFIEFQLVEVLISMAITAGCIN